MLLRIKSINNAGQSRLAIAAISVAVGAAPPTQPRLYPQHPSAQLQQMNPLEYYLDNSEVTGYYIDPQQKQGGVGSSSNAAPARLETLEPDSEVELIPGAQPPQQPPQQTPVAPNIPGLLPGQRVFIVHMPIPGYRPGTIGGYQPVYIVAAAPQGNTGYTPNGYQNTVLVDQSGQVVSPVANYPRTLPGLTPQIGHPGLVFGAPLTVNRPYDIYQDPAVSYHPVTIQGTDGNRGAIRLAQLVGLQIQPVTPVEVRPTANEGPSSGPQQSSQARTGADLKENAQEHQNKERTAPLHAQPRKS